MTKVGTGKRTTPAEDELLSLVLREVRNANATGEQLTIVVDPFAAGDGVHVSFHYNGLGWTTELAGKLGKVRKTTRRAKTARSR